MKHAIYQIRNVLNNKIYIGSAVNVNMRFNTHKSNLNKNIHPNKYLQAAWNKNWGMNFEFEILEVVENKNQLLKREQFWLDKTKCYDRLFGYNTRKIPNSNLGIKVGPQNKEWVEKRASKLRGRKRKPEHVEKTRIAITGRKLSEEHKKKLVKTSTGQIFSEERKRKISEAKSDLNKWPCPDKSFCKCRRCLDLKNLQRKERTKAKRTLRLFPDKIVLHHV